MGCGLTKIVLLTAVLAGLCLSGHANTTIEAPDGSPTTNPSSTIAQTETAIAPLMMDTDLQTDTGAKKSTKIRIALLLPLQSDTLRRAAEAVRAGFQAAYEREKNAMAITVIETDDTIPDVLSGYSAAVEGYDIVVGPLSRTGVMAVAQSHNVKKPTIALTQPDVQGESDIELPQNMLVMGLSVEEEARQVANWAAAGNANTLRKALIVSTNTAWQRRAAKAFAQQWQRLGLPVESVEATVSGSYLSTKSLTHLKKRFQDTPPDLLFAALDATQAKQLYSIVENDLPSYGTSQLNPLTLPEREGTERIEEMNGARLVDIPWQLQPDHPAVMAYPRLVLNADQKRSADLERLYALGIDAYRVAHEIAQNHTYFTIDGVTGKLKVLFGNGMPRFERLELPAIYLDGLAVPLTGMP